MIEHGKVLVWQQTSGWAWALLFAKSLQAVDGFPSQAAALAAGERHRDALRDDYAHAEGTLLPCAC